MSKVKYKQKGRTSLFDKEETLTKLSKLGNPLEKIRKKIDIESFRPELEEHLLNHNRKSKAGSRPFDVLMMFKIMIIKRVFNLSDKQTEYQIYDRLSFKEFLGLASGDRVPNAQTIYLFRKKLKDKDLEDKLFEQIKI